MEEENCRYGSGDVINIADPEIMRRMLNEDCIIEEGAIIRVYYTDYEREDDAFSATVPPSENKSKTTKPLKSKKMEPTLPPASPALLAPTESPALVAPVLVAPVAPVAPVAQAPETTASTAVPAAPFDINAIVGATGGNSSVAIILALLAVVGGTAAWKFWQKLSEQKHEQAMKKMELQADANSGKGPQHPQCISANATLDAKLSALDAKISSLDSKLESLSTKESSFSASFDPDELEDRIKKLEKKLKATASKSAVTKSKDKD